MVGICLLDLLCLLWGQPNQLSPGQTRGGGGGLHPQLPCFLQTQRALCPGQSLTVHPLVAQLGLEAKSRGLYLGRIRSM